MIKKCEKIYVLGYIGKIVETDGRYYVNFENKNQEHYETVNLLRHRLNKIYHREYDILLYLVDKLNLTLYWDWGNFPEFKTLKDLQKFIEFLNKFNLIFIK